MVVYCVFKCVPGKNDQLAEAFRDESRAIARAEYLNNEAASTIESDVDYVCAEVEVVE